MKKKIAALRQARGKQIEIMEANVACSNEQQTKAYNDSKAEAARLAAEADELERLMKEDASEAAAELARQTEINKIANTGKLEATFAAQHVEAGTSVEEFRRLAFEKLAARSAENPTREHHADVDRDEGDTRIVAFRQALLHRADARANPLTDKDPGYERRGLAAQGLLAMASECVRASGKNVSRMAPLEIARLAMHSTSDFPLILGATADASMRAGYAKYVSRWDLIAAKRTASNFKLQSELMLGMNATFPLVPESGEYQSASLSESREQWRVLTYGQKLAITRQVIVNDDLGAITNIPAVLGLKAAIRQADLVWGVIVANPLLADGVAVFSVATHANLAGVNAVINVANIDVLRQLMRAQRDQSGDYLNLDPKYLVVAPAREQVAKQYMSNAFNPAVPANINTEAGTMTVIVEPRLGTVAGGNDATWRIFADPGIAPVVIYAYLSGNEGIYSESEVTTDVDGVRFLARMDFGCGAIDYRGAAMNTGV